MLKFILTSEYKFIFWGCFDFGEDRYWNFPWRILRGWLVFLLHDVRRKISLTQRLTPHPKRWCICSVVGCTEERVSRSRSSDPVPSSRLVRWCFCCFIGHELVFPKGLSNLATSLGLDMMWRGGVCSSCRIGDWKPGLGFPIPSSSLLIRMAKLAHVCQLAECSSWNPRLRTRLDGEGGKLVLLRSPLFGNCSLHLSFKVSSLNYQIKISRCIPPRLASPLCRGSFIDFVL